MTKRTRRQSKLTPSVKLNLPRPLYTVPEACHVLCCGVIKAYELINTGKLEARKLDDRTLVTERSLIKFVNSLPRVGKAAGTVARPLA